MSILGGFTGTSHCAKALCESTGYLDPVEAIRFRSLRLIGEAQIKNPPFSPFVLSSRLGVRSVVFSPIGFDACLLPVTGGYEVQICSAHSRVRQNFSMAHELGHIFFFEVTGSPKAARRETRIGMNKRDHEEEFLCDYAASELLMPSTHFFRDVRNFGPSIASLFELASRYQTSLQATAIKFAEMGLWKCAFVHWRSTVGNSSIDFEVESCTKLGGLRLPICKGIRLSDKKHLAAAVESGKTIRGRESFRLGNIEETYYIESIRLGSKSSPRVLSMIFADGYAEHFAYSSYRQFMRGKKQKEMFESDE